MDKLSALHPILVHFPIVIFILLAPLEAWAYYKKDQSFSNYNYVLFIVGVLFCVLALISGNSAAQVNDVYNLANNDLLKGVLDSHETNATLTMWLFVGLFFYRTYLFLKKKMFSKEHLIYIVVCFIGLYLVYLTGEYGGELVYKFGVGVQK